MVIAPEGFFLQQLFDRLNSSGIRYAVMRNHQPLPFGAGGSDLDLIMAEDDKGAAKILLHEVIQSASGIELGSIETYGFYKVFALGRNNNAEGAWWGLCVDINFGLFFKGQRLISSDATWPVNDYLGIPVLSDSFASILGVLKEVLNNGTIPAKYSAEAEKGVLRDWQAIKHLLAPIGNDSLELLKVLLTSESIEENRLRECRLMRNTFFRHALFTKPTQFFVGRIGYEWSKVSRYLKPSGKVIAFLGVDGAGKSTIINTIKPVLDSATHNTTVVQHLRPTLFPPLARLMGKVKAVSGPVVDPHGLNPSGTVGSLFRLIYLLLDYVVGYWMKTRPLIAKQPTIVIFDRYAYDLVIDPFRFRIALPNKIISWLIKLAPKPDLVICLYGSPEVIVARKGELPLTEVARQVAVIKELAAHETNTILINTECSLIDTCNSVLSALKALYINKCHL